MSENDDVPLMPPEAGDDDTTEGNGIFQRLKNAPLLAGLCIGVVVLLIVLFSMSGGGHTPEADPLVVGISAPDEESIAPAKETAEQAVVEKPETLTEDSAPSTQVPIVAEAALLMTDIGVNRRIADAIIKQLPKETSIAISPYATNAQSSIAAYKSAGNDVWLQIATHSTVAGIDPGPLALSVELSASENQGLLERQLTAAGNGYVGLYIPADADLTTDNEMWTGIAMDQIGKNLVILDGTPARVPTELYVPKGPDQISAYLKADVIVPGDKGPETLKAGLAEALPIILKEREAIVVVTSPTVLSVSMVAEWLKTLPGNGVEMVPASRFTGLKP